MGRGIIGLKGMVINGKIAFKEPLTLSEGMKVEIVHPDKYHLLKHFGILKDRKDINTTIKEIYNSSLISSREVKL